MRNAIPLKTPRAAEVLSARDGTLRVRFRNGEIRDFNARKELFGLPCYRELANDPALFETAPWITTPWSGTNSWTWTRTGCIIRVRRFITEHPFSPVKKKRSC